MAKVNLKFNVIITDFNKKQIAKEIISDKGIYFWFTNKTGLVKLKIPLNNNLFQINNARINYHLLYIGIGPSSKNVKATLKDRIINNHLGSSIRSSTLRQSISALLKMKAQYSSNKIFLNKIQESKISYFINNHLILGIIYNNKPWQDELNLISKYKPPINIKSNNQGWYREKMKYIRKLQRDTARKSIS